MEDKKKMSRTLCVREYFGKDIFPNIKAFRDEWAELDEASKQELATLAAKELNVELR
jgi:hypothetical protein